MTANDHDPLDTTGDASRNAGTGNGLTGGPNPGDRRRDGQPSDEMNPGEGHYSPEMGEIIASTFTPPDDRSHGNDR
jgi:hypothetical protein